MTPDERVTRWIEWLDYASSNAWTGIYTFKRIIVALSFIACAVMLSSAGDGTDVVGWIYLATVISGIACFLVYLFLTFPVGYVLYAFRNRTKREKNPIDRDFEL